MVQTARLFLAGSSIYPALELLYRKKTHVAMAAYVLSIKYAMVF